jgi:hypothetical protein
MAEKLLVNELTDRAADPPEEPEPELPEPLADEPLVDEPLVDEPLVDEPVAPLAAALVPEPLVLAPALLEVLPQPAAARLPATMSAVSALAFLIRKVPPDGCVAPLAACGPGHPVGLASFRDARTGPVNEPVNIGCPPLINR